MRSGDDKKRNRRRAASRRRSRRRAALPLFALAVFASLILWIFASTSFVSVRRVTLVSPRLPAAFEGTCLMYVSDIDAGGLFGAESCADTVRAIASAGADLLVLGGDYSYAGSGDAKTPQAFFAALSDLELPLGKYAVTGERDSGGAMLAEHMAYAGFRCLDDTAVRVEKGGSSLVLAGFGSYGAYPLNPDGIYAGLSADDFVICAAHDPASLPAITAGTSSAPGVSCRLILTGHTHGGQIRLFGRTLLPMGGSQEGGCAVSDGTAVFYSTGLGCEKVPFRIGTQPEALLITLQRQ